MEPKEFEEKLKSIMKTLAENALVFSKEIQFQFEFASELKKQIPTCEIIFENLTVFRNGDTVKEKMYTDITVKIGTNCFPIELKYKTADKTVVYENTENKTKRYTFNQGAVESGCYDFIKDISRIERLLNSKPTDCDYTTLGREPSFAAGFAILLTNYSPYYSKKEKEFYWKNYDLGTDAIQGGSVLEWGKTEEWKKKNKDWLNNNVGKERAEHPIELIGTYPLHWEEYVPNSFQEVTPKNRKVHDFKYLLIRIPPAQA